MGGSLVNGALVNSGPVSARVLVLGDGAWAGDTARRLAAAGHTVAGVVLRRRPSDDALAEAARALGAPIFQPVDPNAPAVLDALGALGADLALSVSYDRLLRAPLLALAPRGTLNVHAGMLPRYRGRNPINWAIANGEREVGVTVHYMDAAFDTGDVVAQRAVPVGPHDGYGDVLARVVALVPVLATEAVAGVVEGRAARVAQAHELATYYPARGADDEWIDWGAPTARVYDLVRAIGRPAPGARATCEGRTVRIWGARPGAPAPRTNADPGRVVARGERGASVRTGDGTLFVTDVSVDGGPAGVPQWLLGARLEGAPSPDGAPPSVAHRTLGRAPAMEAARV